MTREQRIAIWVATLIAMLVAWKLFGQGFGGFRSDQPFLARNYTTASQPFSPLDISNMVYWVDVYTYLTNGSGNAPSHGDEVFTWGDKSTNGYYFTNYYDVGFNYFSTNGPTNGPFLESLSASAGYSMSYGAVHWAQPNTMFVVISQDDTGQRTYLTSTNTSYRNLLSVGATPARLRMTSGSNLDCPSEWIAGTDWIIVTLQYNGANSVMRTNGVLAVTGNAGSQECSRPNLGAGELGTGPDKVVEYIMYNQACSSNDIYQVENYLATKHSITIP